jgi:hypothetical protein
MMLIAALRPPFKSLLLGAVHGLLGRGVAVDSGHEALDDAEAFFEEDVHDRREAGDEVGQVVGGNEVIDRDHFDILAEEACFAIA